MRIDRTHDHLLHSSLARYRQSGDTIWLVPTPSRRRVSKRDTCDAMRAAAEARHFEIAYEIAAAAHLDMCPVCVQRETHRAQRVVFQPQGEKAAARFWICEACATAHCGWRSRSLAVPLSLHEPEWKTLVYSTGIVVSQRRRRRMGTIHAAAV